MSAALLTLVEGEDRAAVRQNAATIAENWLKGFFDSLTAAAASAGSVDIESQFLKDGWFKDELVFSWDLRTLHGSSKLAEYLTQNQANTKIVGHELSGKAHLSATLKEMGPMAWIEAGFGFKTNFGTGQGVLRLANTAVGEWKAWILFMGLEELQGHPRRSRGETPYFHKPQEPTASGPAVVIIGAAGTGLAVAACLQDIGVKSIIIDRSQRVGDVWRNRHKRLVIHSPSYGDARPLLDVPGSWPIFPDKDQYADYLEFYARALDLSIWLGAEFKTASYDDASGTWTVEVTDGHGKEKTLHPRHFVWAGGPFLQSHRVMPSIRGRDDFKGQLYHAAEHWSAKEIPDIHDKKVVVIGSKTSAHDICQDFATAGADVTMIQRSPTIVHSPEACVNIMMPPRAKDVSQEDFFLGMKSYPTFVTFGVMAQITQHMLAFDGKLVDALDKTEFRASRGEDGDSLLRRGVTTRSGFYVNHGASDMIASGKIKALFCAEGIDRFYSNGLVLADGRTVEADIIVAATSWKLVEDALADVVGEEVAARASRIVPGSLIDEEGEARGNFRPTGHPGFWLAAANLMGSSIGAPSLALQIMAIEAGFHKP